MDERSERKYRVADNGMHLQSPKAIEHIADHRTDRKYIDSTSRGGVDVTYHDKGRYSPEEPRSSEASSSQRHPSKKHRDPHHSSSKSSSKRSSH
jgi:hypothetical protein